MSKKLLPSNDYKNTVVYYGMFNNQLLSGINQGLSLYDPVTDTKLYKTIDYDPLDKANFDDINKKLDENYSRNDDLYNNSKAVVNGFVDTINKVGDKTKENLNKFVTGFKDDFMSFFHIDNKTLIKIGGLILILLIIYKKF